MSAYRFVTITCDACGEVWDELTTNSIREARKYATQHSGWRTERRDPGDGYGNRHLDYCWKHPTD